MGDGHNVTRDAVDNGAAVENPDEELAVDLVSTRNKLLRVKRGLADLRAAATAGRPQSEPGDPARPASWFVGVDVELDLARIAEELEKSVEVLREQLAAAGSVR